MDSKSEIIKRFEQNVKGKKFNSSGYNLGHDGSEGHWLEKLMDIKPNASNSPDIFGYEMKKDTNQKTTFGDWSPDIALWGRQKPYEHIPKLDRDKEFLVYFGKPNPLKNGRHSWSGDPAPKINKYNKFGQKLIIDEKLNIISLYSYDEDHRENKYDLLPDFLRKNNFTVARWSKDVIQAKLEKKFNQKGWFKCFKNINGIYHKIGFGKPINYPSWIELVREGVVYFDSGMHAGNRRPYANWRANNNWWNELIDEYY